MIVDNKIMKHKFKLPRDIFDAVILDLNGVITQSAKVHMATWQKVV